MPMNIRLGQLRERVDADPEEASALLLERNTWWLLQELMTCVSPNPCLDVQIRNRLDGAEKSMSLKYQIVVF